MDTHKGAISKRQAEEEDWTLSRASVWFLVVVRQVWLSPATDRDQMAKEQ